MLFRFHISPKRSHHSPIESTICPLYDQAFNTNYMKTRLLRRELVLVFLFTKYNIMLLTTTTELYARDMVLMNMTLQRHPFDVTSIIYSSRLQHMGQTRECIQHLREAKLVLTLSSLIVKIYLNHRVDLSSMDIMTHCTEPFTDITATRSMSARLE